MKNTLETRLGIFFALALIVFVIVLEMAGGLDWFKGGYQVHALFKNIQELKTGDPVKMAGVKVGRVTALTLAKENVKVTMKLDRGTVVRTDSRASIKFASMLGGQNFVAIDFGTDKGVLVEPDALLQTTEQPDMNALLSKLENVATGVEKVTASFSGDRIDNLLGPLTDFVRQNNTNISDAIKEIRLAFANIKDITGQINTNPNNTISRLLKEDTLYQSALGAISNLNDTATDVKGAIKQASLTLATAKSVMEGVQANITFINQTNGTLGRLIRDERLYSETTEAMTNLKEILQKANRGTGTVSQLLNDAAFLKNVKLTLQKVDKATEGLEDQGPLSVLGLAVNSLF